MNTENWGAEGTSSSDLVMPKLQLMQQLSDSVKDDTAKAGDIVDSLASQVLAKSGEKILFMPISTYREWWDVEKVGTQNKILNRYPVTPENENLPGRDVVNGVAIERWLNLNYYVLLTSKLEELPYLISFKRSGLKAGRKLSTAIQLASFKKQPAAATVYALSSKKEKKDRNEYFVFTVDRERASTDEELAKAKFWYEQMLTQKAPQMLPSAAVEALPSGDVPF